MVLDISWYRHGCGTGGRVSVLHLGLACGRVPSLKVSEEAGRSCCLLWSSLRSHIATLL